MIIDKSHLLEGIKICVVVLELFAAKMYNIRHNIVQESSVVRNDENSFRVRFQVLKCESRILKRSQPTNIPPEAIRPMRYQGDL